MILEIEDLLLAPITARVAGDTALVTPYLDGGRGFAG
jgi:hypothetical protein